ncbi:hypothetical protein TPCCA_0132 [Treponema paraluiscuniculi Cuniculi A]|uniref:Uncharacterized protein n=2 Tax=Treponema paraluiscuniculi TaxID=53435 RepID=F7XRX2_TREPU|nr:hypothetical protein TPCCA_0132 [Treponema paraluiscuniculi Cuniculi A]WKC72022.1 hypothetical protein TPLL2_0132 [Treponema paraluiscuniculi]
MALTLRFPYSRAYGGAGVGRNFEKSSRFSVQEESIGAPGSARTALQFKLFLLSRLFFIFTSHIS